MGTYIADLTQLADARRVADAIESDGRAGDVLVHNSGVLSAQYMRTEEGFEATYAAQVLSQHVLTSLLVPPLSRVASPRVIAFPCMHPGWADTRGVQESLPRFRRLTRPILRTARARTRSCGWLGLTRSLCRAAASGWTAHRGGLCATRAPAPIRVLLSRY